MSYGFDYQGRPVYSFLLKKLPQLLDDIPLATWRTVWVLHDGPHALLLAMSGGMEIASQVNG
jgi:hypothetical protein